MNDKSHSEWLVRQVALSQKEYQRFGQWMCLATKQVGNVPRPSGSDKARFTKPKT